jgi:hypothetical protein
MKRWEKKEKQDARKFSSSRTKASGSLWYEPGDHKDETFLYDSKDTITKGFRITKEIWSKLYEEALFSYRIPVLSIRVEDLDLVVLSSEDWEKIKGVYIGQGNKG